MGTPGGIGEQNSRKWKGENVPFEETNLGEIIFLFEN
jgi:hypothetical protein